MTVIRLHVRLTSRRRCDDDPSEFDADVVRCLEMSRVVVLFVVGCLGTTTVQSQPVAPTQLPITASEYPLKQQPGSPGPQSRQLAAPTTKQLLDLVRELASGKQPLAELLDPSVGLLFMDRFEGPGEDGNTIEDLHVCPRNLEAFRKARWASVADAIRWAQKTDHLVCTARPRPTCQAGGAGEWDPVFHFTFGPRSSGHGSKLVLRAIAIDDEVLADPDRLGTLHAEQANLLAHIASCP